MTPIDTQRDGPTAVPGTAPTSAEGPRCAAARHVPWSSQQLFAGRTEIEITHGEHVYRLRQTSLGKLILTK
jgi:hemin uptake protein HemP